MGPCETMARDRPAITQKSVLGKIALGAPDSETGWETSYRSHRPPGAGYVLFLRISKQTPGQQRRSLRPPRGWGGTDEAASSLASPGPVRSGRRGPAGPRRSREAEDCEVDPPHPPNPGPKPPMSVLTKVAEPRRRSSPRSSKSSISLAAA